MQKAEQILLKTTIQDIEVHLLALDSLISTEPIKDISDAESEEHILFINTQMERLGACKNLLWEDTNKLHLIMDSIKKRESRSAKGNDYQS